MSFRKYVKMSVRIIPEEYHVSQTMGFIPEEPLDTLPEYFEEWNYLAKYLHELLEKKFLRQKVDQMQLLDTSILTGYRQHRLAKVQLSFILAGYVWQDGDQGICKTIPKQLAVPLCSVSTYLGEEPIITHMNFSISNYRIKDRSMPFCEENLEVICRFPHIATEWFVAVTICFEKAAVPGIMACVSAVHAALSENVSSLTSSLLDLETSIKAVHKAITRMHEKMSASDFYNHVRPFLSGWGGEGNAAPEGLIYEGVSDVPRQCKGASAGQSSALQCFDAVLGIWHNKDKEAFMAEMRDYMPTDHRRFINAIREHSTVRKFVTETDDMSLKSAYNTCVKALTNLRSYHIQMVTKYIICPSKEKGGSNNFESLATKGTGGSSLMPFLKDIRSTTIDAKLEHPSIPN